MLQTVKSYIPLLFFVKAEANIYFLKIHSLQEFRKREFFLVSVKKKKKYVMFVHNFTQKFII